MLTVKSVSTICQISVNLVLLVVATACAAAVEFNPDLLCTYIANNTKIKDPSACNKYITCVNQKPLPGICEGDLFYDRNTGSCVPPNTVKCYSSNPCAATPGVDGFVSDPYSCSGYFYCKNGKGSHGACSSGMNFNPNTKNCIRNYTCEVKILPEDYCNIVPDGVFIKVPNSCNAYQMCWHGELINGTCPDTFYFNAFKGDCDYPTNVDCMETTTLAPKIPENLKCTKAGVFISDGVSCNGYYYCKGHSDGNIELIHGECPFERFFDPSNDGECVLRTNITCPYNRCVTLGYHNIQLANIDDDGCRGFWLCQEGEIIGRTECPNGMYFDELLQLCTHEVVNYPACAKLDTTLRPLTGTTEIISTTEYSVFNNE
ncbi:peritrophin-44 [Lucilia cuprina]|uniref:peritrophin-44 n=1 Tax=Lucilia cuprina TaxID=7375 RepID=UPI001F0605C4|nr:peritrophin-44 [Lucilia cuprina]